MRIPKVSKNTSLDENSLQVHHVKLNLSPEHFSSPNIEEEDEKGYVRLIKKIEHMVRTSYEYKNYLTFLKNEIDMNNCAFLQNITREDANIEIHHAPFTLFELATIVLNKHVTLYGDEYSIYAVADELCRLHYENKVGLIPLSLTVHELVHRGDIYIPINMVYGNVAQFYEEYKPYITKEQKDLLKNHISTTQHINKDYIKPEILERKYTYIEVDGVTLPTNVGNINNIAV